MLGSIAQGIDYVRRNSVLMGLLLMGAALTIFAMPYMTLLPVFARDILNAGPSGLGMAGSNGRSGSDCGLANGGRLQQSQAGQRRS